MHGTCWICGVTGKLTGEHLIKKSDLKAELPNAPLYFHTESKQNTKVQGHKSVTLKSKAEICAYCNNTRTQPHDRAWEKLSAYLREQEIKNGNQIYLQEAFPGAVYTEMLNVHLYFVKQFGCKIVEYNAPIDIKLFSEAILKNKPHDNLYIAICPKLDEQVGHSDFNGAQNSDTGECVFAMWYYELPKFSVRIMFAKPRQNRLGLKEAWHPSNVNESIKIASNFA